ncbi:MAG: sigma-70 family RNA polymerase sigma factor [Nannocystaceae bacterium]
MTTRISAVVSAPNGWSKDLLAGFRSGERWALTRIYELNVATIAAILRHGFQFSSRGHHHRFVGYHSAFDFQDALHETFRRAFEPRARQGYDGIRPYGPYLATIARNIVLRSFRAREVLFPAIGDDSPDTGGQSEHHHNPLAQTKASPERALHDAQVRELLKGFLAQLEASDREIVDLRFAQGMSQRDAAKQIGMGRQRIRTRELKLRKLLLAYLHRRSESELVAGALSVLLGAELTSTLLGSLS